MTTTSPSTPSPEAPASPARTTTDRGPVVLTRIRRIGAALLAVAAIGILFGLAPKDSVSASDVDYVMASDKINQASADSAPKQTVVNGWASRDLLELVAKQQVANQDPRPAALLTIGVLALCLGLGTSLSPVRTHPSNLLPAPPVPEPSKSRPDDLPAA